MFTLLINEITVALRWSRAARGHIAARQRWPRAGLHGVGLELGVRPCR